MKNLRICFEVQGMAKDENGNPAAAGMHIGFGEISDEKYAALDYFEKFKNANPVELLKSLGMEAFVAAHTESCFRLISPEEYDREYGDEAGEGERDGD